MNTAKETASTFRVAERVLQVSLFYVFRCTSIETLSMGQTGASRMMSRGRRVDYAEGRG